MNARLGIRIVLAAALLAASPQLAHAEAGEGTQSVFASGFGNRALAMGSAFVAGADDPSAVFWNSAGLAQQRWSQVQVAQSSGLGPGFHEALLALAIPDWRWGTGALSVRTFGVDGLEQRDDRNALVASDLRDQELEVALGYAKQLGPALSVGTALKTQRQSIAGLSATGVGVDAGLRMLPGRFVSDAGWTHQLAWGLAVRNLVPPALRLDRESVADPTVLRSGLAWSGALGLAGASVVELDLEHVGAAGTAVHSGIEVRPVPGFALRAGLDGGRLTAGTGFAWHQLGIDYAYLDHPVATEHRLQVSYAFGRSVEERRAAAEQREERLLQARLEDGYRKRRDQQVADLVARAETARAAARYDEALEALVSARTIAPDDARVPGLEVRCLEEKGQSLRATGDFTGAALAYDLVLAVTPGDSTALAGAREARAASDAHAARSQALRAAFASALDAFSEARWTDARRSLGEVLAAAPQDSEAVRMLHRTDQAIAREVVQDLDRADEELQAGHPTQALDAVESAAVLDPGAPGIATRRAECRRQLRAQTDDCAAALPASKPAAPAAAPSTAPRMAPADLARMYDQGARAQGQGNVDESIRWWEMVQAAQPGYRGVDALLTREYLTRGLDAFAAGQLDSAIHDWQAALRINPNDPRARGYLERAREQLTRRREILGEAH